MAQQQTEPAPGGPWEPPPPRSRRRLYRRTDDKLIGGVASGLADYFDIDPVLVRIGFIVLTIAGGAGILAYLVMWWVVPPSHEISNPGEDTIRRLKRAPTWVAIALLIIGGVLLANELGPRHGDLIWGLGLVALGVLLFWHTSSGHRDEAVPAPGEGFAPPPPVPASDPPADPEHPRGASYASLPVAGAAAPAVMTPPPAAAPPPAWTPPPAAYAVPVPQVRKERSNLGLATFGVAFLVVGVAALLDVLNVIDVTLVQYLALGLTVLAAGLLVGSWVGRARWLVLPALILVPFVLVASLVTVPFKGGFADRHIVPVPVAGGSVTYHLVAGRLSIDLTQPPAATGTTAAASATPQRITATVVAGEISVVVPRDAAVHVHSTVGAGTLDTLAVHDAGFKLDRQAGQSSERARIDLNLAVSFGHIEVFRAFQSAGATSPAPAKPRFG
ncbi:MAG TPA: PspC domain-containing protein [Actinomycetota bacterium]